MPTTAPTIRNPTAPASAPQVNFILTLQAERGLPTGVPDGLTKQGASDLITALKNTPRPADGQVQAADVVAPAAAGIPDGHYALPRHDGMAGLPGDDVIVFFKLRTPTQGRWAGYQFVDQVSGDNRIPVRDRAIRSAVLADIAADPQRAMARYGHASGRCGNCNRNLTDDDSRALGIGPDCFRDLFGRNRTQADVAAALSKPVTPRPQPDVGPEVPEPTMPDVGPEVPAPPIPDPYPQVEDALTRSAKRRAVIAARIPQAIADGVPVQVMEDGIREDEVLIDEHKTDLLSMVGHHVERRMMQMEAEGDRAQTTVEETRKAIAKARAEGDLALAFRLEADPAYVAARKARFGF